MKAELVRIGNSRGIRIPKPIIEQCGFGESVELRVEKKLLVVSPSHSPRQGWEQAFRAVAADPDEELLIDDRLPNDFDKKGWRW